MCASGVSGASAAISNWGGPGWGGAINQIQRGQEEEDGGVDKAVAPLDPEGVQVSWKWVRKGSC